MINYRRFLIRCVACGANTSKAYARNHSGQCKACAEPTAVSTAIPLECVSSGLTQQDVESRYSGGPGYLSYEND